MGSLFNPGRVRGTATTYFPLAPNPEKATSPRKELAHIAAQKCRSCYRHRWQHKRRRIARKMGGLTNPRGKNRFSKTPCSALYGASFLRNKWKRLVLREEVGKDAIPFSLPPLAVTYRSSPLSPCVARCNRAFVGVRPACCIAHTHKNETLCGLLSNQRVRVTD